tara:strand:- start:101622 stop:102731 length:1110 start_codon:yes stop_codon:yes gene_type:complete
MARTIDALALEVRKDDWAATRIVRADLVTSLAANEVLFEIDRLALTSNNISYAAYGDELGYWRFFPADDEGWGRIPAMGWASVAASAHPDVRVGERVWGFFPMATHLKVLAGNVSAGHFQDISAHRADLAPIYSRFDRAVANPIYEEAREDQDSLLRGLFMTSWLVHDFLTVNDSFGANGCVITSASSKTSIALAHCVKASGKLLSIGVTSARNVAFCKGLDCYDTVLTYDQVDQLPAGEPVVLVDMAGSAAVLSALHHHYGDNMKYSCRIGATHIDQMGAVDGLPGATPEFFFAPSHVQTRSREIGAENLMMQLGAGYVGFRLFCDGWLQVERHYGAAASEAAYQQVLAGTVDPSSGQIISLWENAGD